MVQPVLSIVMPFTNKAALQLACDVTTLIDEHELRSRPRFPLLLEAGVFYERDEVCRTAFVPGSCERFLSATQGLAEVRSGRMPGLDCDDLATWRAAELRIRYGYKKARAVPVRAPGVGWHILVKVGDGRIEDICKVLGMGRDGRGTRVMRPELAVTSTGAASKAKVAGGWLAALQRVNRKAAG